MMKILLLNPHIETEKNIGVALGKYGISVAYCCDPIQALEVLKVHGNSIDLAVVHREDLMGSGEPGIGFISSLKEDKIQHDLPVILTTDTWTDLECATHQESKEGANAYLRAPITIDAIVKAIGNIFGADLEEDPYWDKELPTESEKNKLAVPPEFASPTRQLDMPTYTVTQGTALMSTQHKGDLEPPAPPQMPAKMPPENAPDLEEPIAEIAAEPEEPSLLLEDAGNLFETQPDADGGTIRLEMPEAGPLLDVETGVSAGKDGESDLDENNLPRNISGDSNEPMEINTHAAMEQVESFASDIQDSGDGVPQPEDRVIDAEMPYLNKKETQDSESEMDVDAVLPMGDALIPGGAADSPDLETLKKYLYLREKDVAALSSQLSLAQARIEKLEQAYSQEKAINSELHHQVDEHKKLLSTFDTEKKLAMDGLKAELEDIKFKEKTKSDKVKILESRIKEASAEMTRLKDRVRADIRKIRLRERDLETKLELRNQDSKAVLESREKRIRELKRKLDLMEFNSDLLNDQLTKERETCNEIRERLQQALQAVRLAGGLLDQNPTEADPTVAVSSEGKAKAS